MAGVVWLSWLTRPCESMHGHAWTLSDQVIASIVDDSRCGMSNVAFRTAQPIGVLSCYTLPFCYRLWADIVLVACRHFALKWQCLAGIVVQILPPFISVHANFQINRTKIGPAKTCELRNTHALEIAHTRTEPNLAFSASIRSYRTTELNYALCQSIEEGEYVTSDP